VCRIVHCLTNDTGFNDVIVMVSFVIKRTKQKHCLEVIAHPTPAHPSTWPDTALRTLSLPGPLSKSQHWRRVWLGVLNPLGASPKLLGAMHRKGFGAFKDCLALAMPARFPRGYVNLFSSVIT